MIGPTETPANDVQHEAAPEDVIAKGSAVVAYSGVLDVLVQALVRIKMTHHERAAIAAAHLGVERTGMAACRALDQGACEQHTRTYEGP